MGKLNALKDLEKDVFSTINCGDFKIIKFNSRGKWDSFYDIKFIETGFERTSALKSIRIGNIKDPYFKNIYGVACIGNASYAKNKKLYSVWIGMIRRCYAKDDKSSSYDRYGAKGVVVDSRWLIFENFLKDVVELEGYVENLKGVDLDKDFKHKDNKIYSKETCLWLDSSLNRKLQRRKGQVDIVVEKDDEFIIFDSIRQCSRILNLCSGNISRALKSKLNKYKGFKFYYLSELDIDSKNCRDERVLNNKQEDVNEKTNN